jgi:hypothetical protein
MTSRKSSGFWSTILETLVLAGRDHEDVDAAEGLDRRRRRWRRNSPSELGPLGDARDLPPSFSQSAGDFLQLASVVGAEHDVGAGAGEHLRRQRRRTRRWRR